MDHCLGHGTCADTMMCTCDQGHGGDSCSPLNPNHVYLKENFKPVNVNVPLRGLIGQHNLQGKFYALISDSFELCLKNMGSCQVIFHLYLTIKSYTTLKILTNQTSVLSVYSV